MPDDKQTVDRIMALKGEGERLRTEVARLEAGQEVAEARLVEARTGLTALGLDAEGDLVQQLDERKQGLESEMGELRRDFETLKAEATA